MVVPMEILKAQYEFVRQSRQVLFDFCSTIEEQLTQEIPGFGRGGSIRNLLIHIANTYAFWIDKWSLVNDISFTMYEDMISLPQIIGLFEKTDFSMTAFFEKFQINEKSMIDYIINGSKKEAHFFQIFSHVITHEFQHKG